jgi:adenine-specific DNA-methyltransferase
MNAELQKNLGAFYTDYRIANYLTSWAIRGDFDKVLDPACGDGVFLGAAISNVKAQNGNKQVYGIDINQEAIESIKGVRSNHYALLVDDFFNVSPSHLPRFDAVVGNPPFVRYQRFNGQTRKDAIKICDDLGIKLSKMSSSWAPFLIHSTRFLKPGGRLAMVVPAEINHASYAFPIIKYFLENFESIKLIAFQEKPFKELSQDTYCLLADGYGTECNKFSLLIAKNIQSLNEVKIENGTPVDLELLKSGKCRILEYLLPERTRTIYRKLLSFSDITALGQLGEVGIGYVTGANDYFHLSTPEVEFYKIPKNYLLRSLRSGRQLKGVRFTNSDWKLAEKANEKVWLLNIPRDETNLPDRIKEYLEFGWDENIPNAYKCKARKPWYSVPHIYQGDLFLTYMTGNFPRLVANTANVVATNTLHVVRLMPSKNISPISLATSWQTSITKLSGEIEGHALGGGMLKLEPSEAKKVRLVLPDIEMADDEYERIDKLLREKEPEIALDYIDEIYLTKGLGLAKNDIISLRSGYEQLQDWRMR